MKRTIALALAASLLIPSAALAHRAWILPAATVLSSEDAWVTFDAAVSNDIFHADYRAMGVDGLRVLTPAGTELEPQNVLTGRHRTHFDLQLAGAGTYKVVVAGSGVFASWMEGGERKRWRGSASELAQAIPAAAEEVSVVETARRLETFVTAGEPDETALAPTGEGLELQPLTHPNDLFAGESAHFRLLIDGEPAVGAKLEIIPGGMRYRNHQDAIELSSDDKGEVRVTWPRAGMYWFSASYEDERSSLPGASRRASYTATFEVLPE